MRAAQASLANAAGVDDEIRRKTLGHSDQAMTSHYTHVQAEQNRAAAEAIAAEVDKSGSSTSVTQVLPSRPDRTVSASPSRALLTVSVLVSGGCGVQPQDIEDRVFQDIEDSRAGAATGLAGGPRTRSGDARSPAGHHRCHY